MVESNSSDDLIYDACNFHIVENMKIEKKKYAYVAWTTNEYRALT